jgi:transcriptional regulator of acetoin/glycerol metabolism
MWGAFGATMPSADEIRLSLELSKENRETVWRHHKQVMLETAEAVHQAKAAGIPMTEAAKLAGVSRKTVYEMLKEKP